MSAVDDLRAMGVDNAVTRWNAVREYLNRRKPSPPVVRQVSAYKKPSVFDSGITVMDILRRTGYGAYIPENPKRLMKCPLPEHADDTASMRIFPTGFHCFGCGQKGGIAELAMALGYGNTRAEAAAWLEKPAN